MLKYGVELLIVHDAYAFDAVVKRFHVTNPNFVLRRGRRPSVGFGLGSNGNAEVASVRSNRHVLE